MAGLKPIWLEFMHFLDLKGTSQTSQLFDYLLRIYNMLEDVYSVSGETELQQAIDQIGDGAGTIFIEAGTHIITTTIDIDGSGSLVIYGHGANTILEPVDGVSVFNITDAESVIFEKLRFDTSNYTGATQAVVVNETNNNIISFEGISIIGNNVGIGIELLSDNCMIEHCNISLMQDGIYINNSNRHIITQNIIQSNVRYGINLNTTLYSNISNNTCSSNLMGIYVIASTHNSISNNICNQNTEHGIYIHSSSNNTLSGNTCENNDSNTANDQAGMYITNNSDFNTISGNSLNNNNNIGAGDGYGLVIATATCEENVVASNNANGNDIDWKDAGLRTVIKYYVQSGDELQDAIDAIGTGAGTVVITTGVLTLTAIINILGGGDYVIEGEGVGSVIDCNGDRTAFNITSAKSCILRNFKIDVADITTDTKRIIEINEGSDNKVIIEKLHIIGDADKKGIGIYTTSKVQVRHSEFINISYGVYITGDYNDISHNYITGCKTNGIILNTADKSVIMGNILNANIGAIGIYVYNSDKNTITGNTCTGGSNGIYLNVSSKYNSFSGNTCNENTEWGIRVDGSSEGNDLSGNTCCNNDANNASSVGGIYVNSAYNTITGNLCIQNNNMGAGYGYGILTGTGNSFATISGNMCYGNDIQTKDTTSLFGTQPNWHKAKAGFYIGNGNNNRTITLGFTPKVVFITLRYDTTNWLSWMVNDQMPNYDATKFWDMDREPDVIDIQINGFRVNNNQVNDDCNRNGYTYYYTAIG